MAFTSIHGFGEFDGEKAVASHAHHVGMRGRQLLRDDAGLPLAGRLHGEVANAHVLKQRQRCRRYPRCRVLSRTSDEHDQVGVDEAGVRVQRSAEF